VHRLQEQIRISLFFQTLPFLAADTLWAYVCVGCGAVGKSQTEALLLFKGEPVAVGRVFAEGKAVVRRCRVDKVNGKVLALTFDKAVGTEN
jgi:hypothetical protein